MVVNIAPFLFGSPSGAQILEAANGTEALLSMTETKPDLVIIDLRLPGISGIQVCREALTRDPSLLSRIIVLTAYASSASELAPLGITRVLLKPVHEDSLAAAISAALSHLAHPVPLDAASKGCTPLPGDVQRVIDYMEAHYGEDLSSKTLAAVAHMSVSHFIRHFRKHVGTTPNEYLAVLRINAASRLLRTTELSVKEIASACGFQSHSHFSQLFRRYKRESPTAWRKAGDSQG